MCGCWNDFEQTQKSNGVKDIEREAKKRQSPTKNAPDKQTNDCIQNASHGVCVCVRERESSARQINATIENCNGLQ